MNDLVTAAHPYLAQYGYKALFVALFTESFGLPLPGETFLIAATLLAINGELSIVAVAGWAIPAVILGDNVGYLIGRRSRGARYAGSGMEWWTKGTGPGSEGMLLHHKTAALRET